jgi:hypothetical protein
MSTASAVLGLVGHGGAVQRRPASWCDQAWAMGWQQRSFLFVFLSFFFFSMFLFLLFIS